jgi:acyl-CoA thioesterase
MRAFEARRQIGSILAACSIVNDPISELLDVLDLKERDDKGFVGLGSGHSGYGLYGGHQIAQSIVAAYRSVGPERRLHSVHALFLRGGDGIQKIDYDVETIRDGRTFCQRRVTGSHLRSHCFISHSRSRAGCDLTAAAKISGEARKSSYL